MELPTKLITSLKNARRLLVLTGAGMSAESGVPTFRDAQSGLWAKLRPEDLATPEAFQRNPQLVWNWYEERRRNISEVRPHPGHAALVELEQHFDDLQVVTQNVDGLHQLSGSHQVIELHGSIMRTICSRTGQEIDDEWLQSHPGQPPVSPHHPQGLARPAVVWFGEQLPTGAMEQATNAVQDCDICFSIGTSTMVQPAASLPFLALSAGAKVIEINPTPTPLSSQADFTLQTTAAKALVEIAAGLAA